MFVIFGSLGQESKITAFEILKKATETYTNSKSISFNTTYNLYLDYKTTMVHEKYTGFVLKKNNINYFKVKNTEFVVFKKYGVKVNHDQKALIIGEKNSQFEKSPLSLIDYLKGFKYRLINANETTYNCELTPANKISQMMISKVILSIKKSDFSLAKQTIFFAENMESKNKQGKLIESMPRLEILFTKRNKNDKLDNYLILQDNYFTLVNSKLVVSPRFSKYKLFQS